MPTEIFIYLHKIRFKFFKKIFIDILIISIITYELLFLVNKPYIFNVSLLVSSLLETHAVDPSGFKILKKNITGCTYFYAYLCLNLGNQAKIYSILLFLLSVAKNFGLGNCRFKNNNKVY
jgi:hypothetical protein